MPRYGTSSPYQLGPGALTPAVKVLLITNSFLLPNMLAKAVTGTSTKESVAWADNEMKKIIAGS